MKILVTGAGGFIGGYIVSQLLADGHTVIGLDNQSKYGPVRRSFDQHKNYKYVIGDAKDISTLTRLLRDCDHLIAGAAKIGGIGYFHEFAYDLIAENERIMAATCDAAITAFRKYTLKKITLISSSMVYESATQFPTKESYLHHIPSPLSTYGFQKLAGEYFIKGAWEQYHVPFTIVRPFNCVGIGELPDIQSQQKKSGTITMAMSHVVPDLIYKTLSGQDPIHILGSGTQIRHYTYGADIARGIIRAMTSKKATNEDFNISSSESTSVLKLARLIWKKINGKKPFHFVSDPAYRYDVQKRIPDVQKAKRMLGFTATTSLDEMVDILIPWIQNNIHIK